jgi:predicted membrane-bound spermidine synthase
MTTTVLDRFVQWNLDFDGDLYGDDERERLRWYEGVTTAAQVQWIAVPWAAAIAVWVAGKPVVVPMMAVLAVFLIPMVFTTLYVRSRRVVTTPRSWSAKRLFLGTLGGLPYVVFAVGSFYHATPNGHTEWPSTVYGAVLGLAIGIVMTMLQARRRRRLDAAAVTDED